MPLPIFSGTSSIGDGGYTTAVSNPVVPTTPTLDNSAYDQLKALTGELSKRAQARLRSRATDGAAQQAAALSRPTQQAVATPNATITDAGRAMLAKREQYQPPPQTMLLPDPYVGYRYGGQQVAYGGPYGGTAMPLSVLQQLRGQ
jgi:hypothetical protein